MLNWPLLKSPLNWIIILVVALFWLAFLTIVFPQPENASLS